MQDPKRMLHCLPEAKGELPNGSVGELQIPLFCAENSKQRLEKRMKVCYDDVNTLICESETNFQKGTVKSWQDLLIQIGLKWKHC